MDPLSALRLMVAQSAPDRIEGRVEAVDEKRGTVAIQLPSGETVEAQGTGRLSAGDKVLLQKVADGLWLARPASQNRSETLAAAALPSTWASLAGSDELAQAVRSGDAAQLRSALATLSGEIASRSESELPADLLPAKARGMSPLASVAARSETTTGTAAMPLSLLEESSPGMYRAQTTGRDLVLQGAPGLPQGAAGLWTESVINEAVSLWVPASVGSSGSPDLPSRISADASGARRLLDRLGIAPQVGDDASFRSLVRSLVRASALSSAQPTSLAASAAPAAAPSVFAQGEAVSLAVPGTASGAFSSVPLDSAPLLVSESNSVSTAPDSPRLSARPASVPAAVLNDAAGDDFLAPRESTAPASSSGDATVQERAAVAVPSTVTSERLQETASLSASAAMRVLYAWSLFKEEPSDEVLAAALGKVEQLPEAIQRLADRAVLDVERFPEVAAFFSSADPETPLMPRHLGLERSGTSASRVEESARPLSEAIVGDLARDLKEDRPADVQVLREALRSLVGEGLDGAKDPSNPQASAPWTMPPKGERPDSGRVVVRDRRSRKENAPERTVVEVSMDPTGLGTVRARLQTVGKELDVQFHVRETATAEKIQGHLPELRQILTGLGYETRELSVDERRAIPSSTPKKSPRRPGTGGIDIRA